VLGLSWKFRPKTSALVTPRIPCGPPINGWAHFDAVITLTISPSPRVTIAR
jgi:hypothetical protein